MNQKWKITCNSAIIYVIAFLLTTIVHELAHAMVGFIEGSKPVLHHNYVEHFSKDTLSVTEQVFVALAGPFTSLIQGILAGIISLKSSRQRLVNLFWLWFAVLGLNNFLGYVMAGPIFKVGDIGKAYQLLETSLTLQLILAGIAAIGLVYLAYKLTAPFLEFSFSEKWVNTQKARKNFSFHILILPWLIGSAAITLLYPPIIALVSIIYPIMSGMIFIFPWQNAATVEVPSISRDTTLGKISSDSILSLAILIILFRIVLALGIEF